MIKKYTLGVTNNRGDTIVEVLVAIAVVSLVLAGAFTSTRHSANATRSAQEQGEALKIAESQVEQIKIAVETGKPSLAAAPASFCISGATTPDSTAAVCKIGLYQITITKPDPLAPDTYATQITWDKLGGGANSVELDYRIQ